MFKLIQNEWLKILKRPGTYVMTGLLVFMIMFVGGIVKYQLVKENPQEDKNWKQTMRVEVNQAKLELKNMGHAPKQVVEATQKNIALKEYQINHSIPPTQKYAVWDFVSSGSGMIQLAGLFTIIIAAGIVSSEFTWGTIKFLLIRPISRGKILVSKYITVIMFSIVMLVILFSLSSLLGVILFGTPETSVPYLNYLNGKVTEQNMALHLIILYGMKSIGMIMLATMAFMISAAFRNSSLAIGISIFLLFTGGELTGLLALKFNWAKYILFANTDLMQYFEGEPMVDGMTLSFSVIMLAVYFIIFQSIAFYVFKKRDVAA
ncbi:MAG: ABC transporter permease [Bacillota bacterium]|nr:ABC transporter permease [Bacillota bacterium]